MIRIDRSVWEQMAGYCRIKLPEEACGALFGPVSADSDTITRLAPIANASTSPETGCLASSIRIPGHRAPLPHRT
ncbi:MAG: hypothetical protein K0R28_5033 [Paenibacillus sp.]|nr:hypothetical protein [Paenibacillus sp.]